MTNDIFFHEVSKYIALSPLKIKALMRLGIENIRDLLFHRPIKYLIKFYNFDIKTLKSGELVILDLSIIKIALAKRKGAPSKIYCIDQFNNNIMLVFFNPIHRTILQYLHNTTNLIVDGKLEKTSYDIPQMVHPDFIFNKNLINFAHPVYPLTYGITNSQIYSYIIKILDIIPDIPEFNINIEGKNLPNFKQALVDLHKPSDPSSYIVQVDNALKRLSLDEALAYKLNILDLSKAEKGDKSQPYGKDEVLQQKILNKLNFTLSAGQLEVLNQIESDQASSLRMVRMLQGDVGSGKTLVALMSSINVLSGGAQAALMVPTDLLARQHYNFFHKAFQGTNFNIALLTGKTKVRGRREILEQLKSGTINLIIGTHSLFQKDVIFNNLGLVVIDEQHRFGVKQRLQLINKEGTPDILTMTATPIPRSLALALFGNIDVSKLINNIGNRKPIMTTMLNSQKIDDLMLAMKRKLDLGEKIYWVCPLIEEQEDLSTKKLVAANERFENLRKIFGNSVGMIHGQVPNAERDAIMQDFKSGDIHILVATTVIEVGIDVSNATLIIIEHSENFGLAQLHQLRGRVGRSSLFSHCILLYSYPMSNIAKERLSVLKSSQDGFFIAEMDLKLRGGGEFLGVKQSGVNNNFIFLDLYTMHHIVENINCSAYLSDNTNKGNFIRQLFNKDNLGLLE